MKESSLFYSDAKERYSRPIRDSYETVVIEMHGYNSYAFYALSLTHFEGFKESLIIRTCQR